MNVKSWKRPSILPILCLNLAMGGCATNAFQSGLDRTEGSGVEVITRSPETDAIVISASSSTSKFCLSPESDAIPIDSFGVRSSVSVTSQAGTSGTGTAGLNGQAGTVTLGGVTSSVLISREILFRTCEFIINHELNDQEATDLFKLALTQVGTIATTDTTVGDTGATANTAPPPPAN